MQDPQQHTGPHAANDFPSDPRLLPLAERQRWARRLDQAQRHWLQRLARLVEPPAPLADFPAFLLETPPFRDLHRRLGDARLLRQLPVATADELQRFVDAYREYLRSSAGEQSFASPIRVG